MGVRTSLPADNPGDSAADVADLTFFTLSLLLRCWVGKTEGFIWAPVVARLRWPQICVIPSGKDQEGDSISGL
jgi:hypothetical protein